MKKSSLVCLLVIAVLAPPSLQLAAESVREDPERGRALFRTQCRVCHLVRHEGDQPTDYTRQFRPSDFSNPDAWKDLDGRKIREAMKKGKGVMPAQKQLKPEEVEAIADYLVRTYQPKAR